MDTPASSNRDTSSVESVVSSSFSLLKQGLEYLQQGRYADGIALCTRWCEELPPEMLHLAAIVNAFLESHAHFMRAREALDEASRGFVEAENKQQTLLLAVQKLLQVSKENLTPISPQVYSSAQESHDHQALPRANPEQAIATRHQSNQIPRLLHVSSEDQGMLPALSITFFGRFEVRRQGQRVELCQNRNGQAIFRYLLAQSAYRATADTLMALLWPEDQMEVARHKVQVAVSALRRSLNQRSSSPSGEGYILCKNGIYQVNPAVAVSSDVERFLALYKLGRQSKSSEAMNCFEQACRLYTGPFLAEDIYADWSLARREQLNQHFIAMCRALSDYQLHVGRYEEAEQWARVLLAENNCDEDAHRLLITIYVAQGRRSEAIHQYQLCKRILVEELGLPFATETITALSSILFSESTLAPKASNHEKTQEKLDFSLSASIERK